MSNNWVAVEQRFTSSNMDIAKNVEKSYPCNIIPDLENSPRQIHGRRNENDDNNVREKGTQECFMAYQEAQGDRALYQPTCG